MSTTAYNTNLERLIAEVHAAREAGVFNRTNLDVAALNAAVLADPPAPSWGVRFYERALVGLPLAACLAIVIGIGSMIGGPTGNKIGSVAPSPLAALDTNGEPYAVESHGIGFIAGCFSGPGEPVAPGCGSADLDRDGDVDLIDFGSYQRLAASVH